MPKLRYNIPVTKQSRAPALTCRFRSRQVDKIFQTGGKNRAGSFSARVFLRSKRWRCFPIATKEIQINEQIHDSELRIIGEDGAQLGVMSAQEALVLAEEKGLDLVKIAPNATPPVCRIMDYGKYRFEQAKKEKEARKNQRQVETKEIRLSLNIDVADFNTKAKHALRFLQDGNKVKVSIRFRGREMGHPEIGLDTMNRFAEACAEMAQVEKPAKMEGRNMLMFLAPKAAK